MKSRRIVLQTLAMSSLVMTQAFAQSGEEILPEIAGRLSDQQRVRQAFRDMSYYVELLRRKVPEKVQDAELTLQQTFRAYEANYVTTDWKNVTSTLAIAEKAYNEHLRELEGLLKDVGIMPGSVATQIITEAIGVVLLVHLVVNKVQDAFNTPFCIFPFCFGRPG